MVWKATERLYTNDVVISQLDELCNFCRQQPALPHYNASIKYRIHKFLLMGECGRFLEHRIFIKNLVHYLLYVFCKLHSQERYRYTLLFPVEVLCVYSVVKHIEEERKYTRNHKLTPFLFHEILQAVVSQRWVFYVY